MSVGTPPPVLQAANRDWTETNCYVDLWIEILHARGLEAEAMLGFTVAIDFEFDQWTFYKPRPTDLDRLYGIGVEELTLWKDLPTHLATHVEGGRVPLLEVDSFYLPDTRGRAYRVTHAKSTIGIETIDPAAQSLTYLHNRSRATLSDADYRGLFRLDPPQAEGTLPPFCEIAKLDRVVRRSPEELRGIADELLPRHFSRRPDDNPIGRYALSVEHDLEALFDAEEDAYDLYAFASIRQCGSAFGLAAEHLRWLGHVSNDWCEAIDAFETISGSASMLVLKMARIVHTRRMRDLSDSLSTMERAWDRAMTALDRAVGT